MGAALAVASCFAFGQNAPMEKPESTVRLWLSEKEVNSAHGQFSSQEILKELSSKCVGVVLTDSQEKADYRLEAGHAWCCTPQGQSRGYVFTLFNKEGDAVFSTKTHGLGNAVKDVCKAIGHEKEKENK
jgi:hypothetical protein